MLFLYSDPMATIAYFFRGFGVFFSLFGRFFAFLAATALQREGQGGRLASVRRSLQRAGPSGRLASVRRSLQREGQSGRHAPVRRSPTCPLCADRRKGAARKAPPSAHGRGGVYLPPSDGSDLPDAAGASPRPTPSEGGDLHAFPGWEGVPQGRMRWRGVAAY